MIDQATISAAMPQDDRLTKLSPQEEAAFQEWWSRVARHKGLDPNPDAREHFYDMRLFYKREPELATKMLTGDPQSHFTDIGKLPGHPTFSNESAYFNEQNKKRAGWWNGEIFIPFDGTKPGIDAQGRPIPPVVNYRSIIQQATPRKKP